MGILFLIYIDGLKGVNFELGFRVEKGFGVDLGSGASFFFVWVVWFGSFMLLEVFIMGKYFT